MYIKSTIKTIKNKDLTVIIGSEEGEELNLNMAGENPVTIDMDGNLDDIYHPASLTSANLRFVFNDEDKVTENNDKETLRTVIEWLSGISFNEVPVAVLLDNQLIFSGFVNPNIREGNYYDPVTELEIVAYDLLTSMQYIKFNPLGEYKDTSNLDLEVCIRRCHKVLLANMGTLRRFSPIYGKVDSINLEDSILKASFSRFVFQKDNEGNGDNGFASYLDIYSEFAKILGLTIIQIPAGVVYPSTDWPCILFTDYNDDYNSEWKLQGFRVTEDNEIVDIQLHTKNEDGNIIDLYMKSRGTGDTISEVNNYTEVNIKTNQDKLTNKNGEEIDRYNLTLIDFSALKNIKSTSEDAPTIIENEAVYDTNITGSAIMLRFGSRLHNRKVRIANSTRADYQNVEDIDGNKFNCIRLESTTDDGDASEDSYTNHKARISDNGNLGLSTTYAFIGNIPLATDDIIIENYKIPFDFLNVGDSLLINKSDHKNSYTFLNTIIAENMKVTPPRTVKELYGNLQNGVGTLINENIDNYGTGLMRFGTSNVSPKDAGCNPSFKDYLVISSGIKNLNDNNDFYSDYSPSNIYSYKGTDGSSHNNITEMELAINPEYTAKPYLNPVARIINNQFDSAVNIETRKHNAFILSMDITYPNAKDIFNLPLNNFSSFDPDKDITRTDKYGVYPAATQQYCYPYAFLAVIKFNGYYFGNFSEEDLNNSTKDKRWMLPYNLPYGSPLGGGGEEYDNKLYYSENTVLYTPIVLSPEDDKLYLPSKASGKTISILNQNNPFSGYYSKEKGQVIEYANAINYERRLIVEDRFADIVKNISLNNKLFSIDICRPLPTVLPSTIVSSYDSGWKENAGLLAPTKLFISDFKVTLTGNRIDEEEGKDSEESSNATELKLVKTPNKIDKSVQIYKDEFLLKNSVEGIEYNNSVLISKDTNLYKNYFPNDVCLYFPTRRADLTPDDIIRIFPKASERGSYIKDGRILIARFSDVNIALGSINDINAEVWNNIKGYWDNEWIVIRNFKDAELEDGSSNYYYISVADKNPYSYGKDYVTNSIDEVTSGTWKLDKCLVVYKTTNTAGDNNDTVLKSSGYFKTEGLVFKEWDKISSDKFKLWKIYKTYMENGGLISVSKCIDFEPSYQLNQYDWKKIVPEGTRGRGGGYWYEWDEVIEHVIHRKGDRYLNVTNVKSDIKPEDTIELGTYIQTDETIVANVQTYPNKATSPSTSLLLTNPPKVGDYYFVTNNVEYGVDFVTREPYQDASGVWRFDTTDYTGTRLEYYDEPSNYGKHTFRKYVSENGTQSIWYPNSGSTVANFGIFTKFEERDGELYAYSVDLRRGTMGDFNPMGFTYTRGQYEEDEIEYETIHHKEWIPTPVGLGTILRIITSKVDLANESIECDLAMITNCYEQNMDLTSEYHQYKAYYVPSNKDYNLDGSINFGGSVTEYVKKTLEDENSKLDFDSNKAVITKPDGTLATSITTAKEVGFLTGARSNIQKQIDDLTLKTEEGGGGTEYTAGNGISIQNNIISNTRPQKVFTTKSEIGITGSKTTKEYFLAIPYNCLGIFSGTQIPSDTPKDSEGLLTLSTVVIFRGNGVSSSSDGSLGFIRCYSSNHTRFTEYDYYMTFGDDHLPTGTWKAANGHPSSWINGYKNAGIKFPEKIDGSWKTCYLPILGWPSSKQQGGTYGDYNVSIGTQPSGDTAASDTRLFINWDNGTATTDGNAAYRGYFQKDGTTSFKTRGLTPNKILISNADGVATTSAVDFSGIPATISSGGSSKCCYMKYGRMVLVTIEGATLDEVRAVTLPKALDNLTHYYEFTAVDGNGNSKMGYLNCSSNVVTIVTAGTTRWHGQFTYFSAS